MSFVLSALLACSSTKEESPKDTGSVASDNAAPSAPVVAIQPAAPGDDAELEVVIVEPATDPDGDALAYRYEWQSDGTLREGLVTDRVPADRTSDGEVWTVRVYPSDLAVEGDPGIASVTIGNSAPIAPTIRIDPSAPAAGDALTLVFDAPASDPNPEDSLTQTIRWTVDGVAVADLDDALVVPGAHVRASATITAEVAVSDGHAPIQTTSASVTVANTLPTLVRVTVSPVSPSDGRDLACQAVATDDDGDALTTRYRWTRDGVEATEVGDTPAVDGSVTSPGERWVCEATVSDGGGEVTGASLPVTINSRIGHRVTRRFDVSIAPSEDGTLVATGTVEWDVYASDAYSADCDVWWTLVASPGRSVCDGCTYSFEASYDYDDATSRIGYGCPGLPVDSGGSFAFNRSTTGFYATLDAPEFSFEGYGPGLGMWQTREGGRIGTYIGYYYADVYSVAASTGDDGAETIVAYAMQYLYY